MYAVGFGDVDIGSEVVSLNVTGSPGNYNWSLADPPEYPANEDAFALPRAFGIRDWGGNLISQGPATFTNVGAGSGKVVGFASSLYSFGTSETPAGASQMSVWGDAGGGVFNASGQFIGAEEGWGSIFAPSDLSFTEDLFPFGETTEYADIYDYVDQIESVINTPEPAALLPAGLLLTVVLNRRPRRRQ
jgi:hypothetical protein